MDLHCHWLQQEHSCCEADKGWRSPSCELSSWGPEKTQPRPLPSGADGLAGKVRVPCVALITHCTCPRTGAEVEGRETAKAGQPVCVGGGCWRSVGPAGTER